MNKILSFLAVIACLLSLEMLSGAETAKQPAVGTPAPDFSLSSGDGSHVSLKDYRGKWVVLYFYPKDFTSGCTLEAKNFERDLAQYQNAGAIILGVSVDSAQSHKDFSQRKVSISSCWPMRTPRFPRSTDQPCNIKVQSWRREIRF